MKLEPCRCGAAETRLRISTVSTYVSNRVVGVTCIDCGRSIRRQRDADHAWNIASLLPRVVDAARARKAARADAA